MHKRGYPRKSQDEKPWLRVVSPIDTDSEGFNLISKKTVRWISGNRRDRETRVLNSWKNIELKKIMLQSFFYDQNNFSTQNTEQNLINYKKTIFNKINKFHKLHSIARSKNTCLFSGKGSTFNRKFLISRQVFRNLTRFGIIPGLISGKRG